MSKNFKLVSPYEPKGDQPKAIERLVNSIREGSKYQTLLGVTGSGKTYTMASVIERLNRPTLVMSHNKTLAAQLYGEFKSFFPENAVEYFISYYDYYQPEAYIPTTDTYIEKDASINEEIDKLRLRATSALFERRDVIIVASVSCIYGLGSPKDYYQMLLYLKEGDEVKRDAVLEKLVDIHYVRNDVDFGRGTFRVRGDVLEVHLAYEEKGIRVEFFGDEVDRISEIDILTGKVLQQKDAAAIYPAKHFVVTQPQIEAAIKSIELELDVRLDELQEQNKLLEYQRLDSRTNYDIEMIREIGYCSGIENYSRHMDGRPPGSRPYCLMDYFPDDFLLFVDESHVTIPQVRGMYAGDRSRKQRLVDYGFRLPSALDNRPLKFPEFTELTNQAIFVSATPADYEIQKSGDSVFEQIIRPTGLMDPEIEVRPIKGQIDDLIEEIRVREEKKERVLVTTLTKRMAEDLTEYLTQMNIRVRYMHSDIAALERMEIIRGLRLAEFDVLVGINLLREGLDLPEVSLVAILDADKEGFLRSERSLIQTAGRAARNATGKVILYAERITGSMRKAIDETNRRRAIQQEYNEAHGIVPETIYKSKDEIMRATSVADERQSKKKKEVEPEFEFLEGMEVSLQIKILEEEMKKAARNLEFERAAALRDKIKELRKKY